MKQEAGEKGRIKKEKKREKVKEKQREREKGKRGHIISFKEYLSITSDKVTK